MGPDPRGAEYGLLSRLPASRRASGSAGWRVRSTWEAGAAPERPSLTCRLAPDTLPSLPVHFRYVVFHPFLDEILIGKIKGCSPEGVHGNGGPNSSDEAGSTLGRVARAAGLPSASVLGRRSGEGSDAEAEASKLSGKPGREGDTQPPRAQCRPRPALGFTVRTSG